MTSGQLVTNTSLCLVPREKLTYKTKSHVTDNSKSLHVGPTYKFLHKNNLNTNIDPINYVTDKKSKSGINPVIPNSGEYNVNRVEPETSREQTPNKQTLNHLVFRGKTSQQGAKSRASSKNKIVHAEGLHKFSVGRNILQYKTKTSGTSERTKSQLSRENLARSERSQVVLDDSAPGMAPVNAPVNMPVNAPANAPINAPVNAPATADAPPRRSHVPHSDVDVVSDVHLQPCQSLSSAKHSWSFIPVSSVYFLNLFHIFTNKKVHFFIL